MVLLLPLARYVGALSFLLLLGACQRASYSFQSVAPAAYRQALPLALADTLPAATQLQASAAAREGHKARRWLRAPAKAPRPHVAPFVKTVFALARPAKALPAISAARVAPHLPPQSPGELVPHRSKGIALLLAAVPLVFALPLGLHYFYLGYTGRGLASLGIGLAALALVFTGFVSVLGILFGSVGSGRLALFIIGGAVLATLGLQQLVDVMHIISGELKPKNGDYYPRFLQTRAVAGPAPPGR